MGKTGKAAGKVDVETQVKQQRCLDLVVAGGWTYEQIAEEVGYAGESGARQAVDAILKRTAAQSAEQVRPGLILRAEALWAKAYRLILRAEEEGDVDMMVKALAAGDRALARLGKWQGVEGPEVSVVFGAEAGELDRLRSEFEALLSRPPVVDGEVVSSIPDADE